ncbi:MAG TPA: peptidase E [Candidatus Limnocylindria bacterium]|nr:peptidase E [Candidatus Limnocylindria bacterium]
MTRRIIACGGRELYYPRLVAYVLSFAKRPRPKVLFLPTASGDDSTYLTLFRGAFKGHECEPAVLELFDRTVDDVDALVRDHDVVVVGGGNTANMLAIWRVHGVDGALRAAYDAGTVLTGWSAGCICWFEGGTTDSFTPELGALRDGLGFLGGSATPHYDSEARRAAVYAREIGAGLPPGIALDDGVAASYADERLVEVVSERAGGRAFMVDRSGEHPLPVRRLV